MVDQPRRRMRFRLRRGRGALQPLQRCLAILAAIRLDLRQAEGQRAGRRRCRHPVAQAATDVSAANAPYPLWQPADPYVAGYKVVRDGYVYQAKWYNQATDPAAQMQFAWQTPWLLIGPVLPGDHASPTTTLAPSTDPAWDETATYQLATRCCSRVCPTRPNGSTRVIHPLLRRPIRVVRRGLRSSPFRRAIDERGVKPDPTACVVGVLSCPYAARGRTERANADARVEVEDDVRALKSARSGRGGSGPLLGTPPTRGDPHGAWTAIHQNRDAHRFCDLCRRCAGTSRTTGMGRDAAVATLG